MAALIQELLRDYDRLPIEQRVDLYNAVKRLVCTRQITRDSVYYLYLFAIGYSVQEIELVHPHSREPLLAAFALVANETGYTDESFMQTVLRKYPKFRNQRGAFAQRLHEYTSEYTNEYTSTEQAKGAT